MLIELTAAEAELLQEVLRQDCRRLIDEINHADDRAYRLGLRQRLERLEHIATTVAAAVGGQERRVAAADAEPPLFG